MFSSLPGVLGSSESANGLPTEQLLPPGPLYPLWAHEVVMALSWGRHGYLPTAVTLPLHCYLVGVPLFFSFTLLFS